MKILSEIDGSAHLHIRTGWKNAFEYSGHQFRWYNREKDFLFDIFNEYKPDWYIGTTYNVSLDVEKCIRKFNPRFVTMFCSAWGELTEQIDKKEYPIVYITDTEKQKLEKLKKETGKPDYVFIHITDKWLEPTIGKWKEIGIKPVGILNAADILTFFNSDKKVESSFVNCPNEKLRCDMSLVSGYWPYKAKNLDKYIIRLCDENRFDIKIFGWGNWPVPQHLGHINNKIQNELPLCSTICPNISEGHSYIFPDITERVFKVISSGGFCIHDNVKDLHETFPLDCVPQFSNYNEFVELVENFSKNNNLTKPYIEKSRKIIFEEHTYFDRVSKMFNGLGLQNESQKALKIKRELLNELQRRY